MIQKYIIQQHNQPITQYRVRVGKRSRRNPMLRVTKQEGGIATEALAIKREAQLKKECEREISEMDGKGVIFSELVSDWYTHFEKLKVASGQRSKTTHDEYLGSIKKWFLKHWNKPAVEINAYVVTIVFEEMKTKGLAFAYRKKVKQTLKSIFDFGIQSRLLAIPRSPTFDVVMKADTEPKPEILTIQEIQKLIAKAFEENHEWRRIWFMALTTGMRSGELQALEWNDVNWENNLINVNKSYSCKLRSYKSTKSGCWRQVPISNDLLQILKEQQAETGSEQYVFPRNWEWDKGLQAKVLRAFCYAHDLPSIKFHTLRACFATQMLRSGVETARVMKICGWKELKTMQYYVRLAGVDIEGSTDCLKIYPDKN